MQAQTTNRMAGANGLVIAFLAIALAVLTIVVAAKISGLGESSSVSQPQAEAQTEEVEAVSVAGAEVNVSPNIGAASLSRPTLVDEMRFLEFNTVLPGYSPAGSNRLSVHEILFLEANLLLPGPTVAPGSQLLTHEILFLEANLHMPGMDAQEAAPSAEETHFIEINTNLPDAGSPEHSGRLPRE